MTTRTALLIRWACGLIVAVAFLREAKRMLAAFPFSYTWTELLINYQGGFVRRGLLGEVAYQLDALIPAAQLLIATILLLYLFIVAAITCAFPPDQSVANAAFFLCPAGMLFPVYDPLAYGRKEVVIVTALLLTTWLARRIRRPATWLVTTAVIYFVAGFVIEAAFFYLPTAVTYFLLVRARELKRGHYVAFGLATIAVAVGWFTAMSMINGVADLPKIIASWREHYPHAYDVPGALVGFNTRIRELHAGMLHHQSSALTTASYLLGFVLGIIPLALLWMTRDRSEVSGWAKQMLAAALFVMFLPFGIAADWGRFTYLFVVHAFVLLAALPEKRHDDAALLRTRPLTPFSPTVALFLLVYGSTWTLQHFASHGSSALKRGVVIQLFSRPQAEEAKSTPGGD
jgi:hypothetical protein